MDEDMVSYARRAYLRDDIDIVEFEAALDHIAAGGMGDRDHPYLSVFRAFQTEVVMK